MEDISSITIRSLSRSLLCPETEELQTKVYCILIQSIWDELPEEITIRQVAELLGTHLDLSGVSETHISNALYELLEVKKDKRLYTEDQIYQKSQMLVKTQPSNKPFEILYDIFIEKVQFYIKDIDDYQKSVFRRLLEEALIILSESVEDMIAAIYNKKEPISETLLDIIEKRWREIINEYDSRFIEKLREISNISLYALKEFFADKDRISLVLGALGTVFIYRAFLCVDPELKKLNKLIFNNSFIFIDTNILISYICKGSLENEEVTWLLNECNKNLGIDIIMIDDTIEEYNRIILKDTVKYKIQTQTGIPNLEFAERDIPMGYYNKWSNTSWNAYVKYLERGVEIFHNDFHSKVNSEAIECGKEYLLAKKSINDAIPAGKYKDDGAINHDIKLIYTGHKQYDAQHEDTPSFIFTRDRTLIKAEKN